MLRLIDRGRGLNTAASNGTTSLQLAATFEFLDLVVKSLVMRGAAVNLHGSHGVTALRNAADGSLATVRYLLAHGADLNVKGVCGYTPLHAAALLDRLDAAEALIAAGADVNARTTFRETPLDLALAEHSGHQKLLAMLWSHGARSGTDPGLTTRPQLSA